MSSEAIASETRGGGDILEQNLKRYLLPRVAQHVRCCGLGPVRMVSARSGDVALQLAGRPLCSRGDPRDEGVVWAERQLRDIASSDIAIVIGLGAGYHIEALRRSTDIPLLVVEPCHEVLNAVLSQRTWDWRGVYLVDTPSALTNWLSRRVGYGSRIRVLSWPPTRRYFPSFFAAARAAAQRAAQMAGINASTLDKRLGVWTDSLLANLPRTVDRVPAMELAPRVAGRPVFVVAAGPSLNRNAHHLREVGDRGVIVAVNTSLGALERAGVKADLVVAVELLDVSAQLNALEINRDCPRVLTLAANSSLYDTATGPVLPLLEGVSYFTTLGRQAGLGDPVALGGSVANTAFSLCRQWGASQITLVGQDLAYTDSRVYADGTVFEAMRVNLDGATAKLSNLEAKHRIARSLPTVDNTREQEGVEWVEGWNGQPVCATKAFNYFRLVFEDWASHLDGIRLINATEGGARIHGFAQHRLREVVAALPSSAARRPFPSSPTIAASQVAQALRSERERVHDALSATREAIADPSDEAIAQMKHSVGRSGLLYAASWSPVVAAMRSRDADIRDLCQRISDSGEQLLKKIDSSIDSI